MRKKRLLIHSNLDSAQTFTLMYLSFMLDLTNLDLTDFFGHVAKFESGFCEISEK